MTHDTVSNTIASSYADPFTLLLELYQLEFHTFAPHVRPS